MLVDKPTQFTPDDGHTYEDIVLRSFVYKRYNDPHNSRVKSNGGYKYKYIIRPILERRGLLKSKHVSSTDRVTRATAAKQGTGALRKIVTNNPVEYVYWNSIDELLERLYILYGELKAGNSNPNIANLSLIHI